MHSAIHLEYWEKIDFMKTERGYEKAIVSKKAEASIQNGHPWVYAEEILETTGLPDNGGLMDVVSQKGKYLGTGYLSLHSKIRIRIISKNANDKFDAAFYERRLRHAWEYRKTVMGEDLSCCRVIFGEADHFPGLTVDLFRDVLVTQTLSVGIDRLKPMLFPMLFHMLREDGIPLKGIYERNDVAIRAREGLEQYKGWFPLEGIPTPQQTQTDICENGITYTVDFENGQKTGYFLDQKYNRALVGKLAKGKRVLDCFTHTGSFALNAAKGGAEWVTAVDVSKSALQMAEHNARQNGLTERMEFVAEDVFDLLPRLIAEHAKYDLIILDPPAFTKSRSTMLNAMGGYREINKRAMQLLPRGGYLATCSCSHFASEAMFRKMLANAAQDASVSLRQIEVRQQGPDHPILWGVEETNYLKFFVFQIS